MAGTAHHRIGDAERVHDVERKQRDVRRLQHIAAGVEHEIRHFAGDGHRGGALAEPLECGMIELQPRQRGDVAAGLAISGHAVAAPRGEIGFLPPHRAARHRQQEARVDAVLASLDAIAAQHAGGGPAPGGFRAIAVLHEIDHAGDDFDRRGVGDIGGRNAGADLDAFAAFDAGLQHVASAIVQRRFKTEISHDCHRLSWTTATA